MADHMRRAADEHAALAAAYAASLVAEPPAMRALLPATLELDLDGPVKASPSALHALSRALPELPLQWTALRNSITTLLERSGDSNDQHRHQHKH